jgi:N6-adenosine-specific RNA methylase IME4
VGAKYATIVADPPWPYADGPTPRQRARGDKAFLPYPTMPLDAIARTIGAVDVVIDAHLYLWTTQRFLWETQSIAQAAGYMPQQVLVWCKPVNGAGMGGAFAPTVEFCVFCRRNWGRTLVHARDSAGMTSADVHRAIRGGPITGLVSMWMKGERYPNDEDWDALGRLFGDFGNRAGLPRPIDSSWFHWPRAAHSQKPEHFLDMVEQASPGPYLELWSRRRRLGWDVWGNQVESTIALAAD